MNGVSNQSAYATDASKVKFGFSDLKKAANGSYNIGEVLLGKNGKLVHVNSSAYYFTKSNNVVATGEQNYAVREAICGVLKGKYGENGATKAVMEHLLSPKNSTLPLSRDELRKLIELCELGNTGMTAKQIDNRLSMITRLGVLKRQGLTEKNLKSFQEGLAQARLNTDLGQWIKGLGKVCVIKRGKNGTVSYEAKLGSDKEKARYASVMGQTVNQLNAKGRILEEADIRRAIDDELKAFDFDADFDEIPNRKKLSKKDALKLENICTKFFGALEPTLELSPPRIVKGKRVNENWFTRMAKDEKFKDKDYLKNFIEGFKQLVRKQGLAAIRKGDVDFRSIRGEKKAFKSKMNGWIALAIAPLNATFNTNDLRMTMRRHGLKTWDEVQSAKKLKS